MIVGERFSFSEWLKWAGRGDLPKVPGIYRVAKSKPSNIIYCGKSWGDGGVRKRVSAFHYSATTGLKRHAGGVTYHHKFGKSVRDLLVSVHIPYAINTDPEILWMYIRYAERAAIWDCVRSTGAKPICNID